MKSLATIKPRFRGPEGRKLQLNVTATHLQWRLEGDPTWTDLASLDSLATLTMPKSGGAFTGNIQVRNIVETLVGPVATTTGVATIDLSLGSVFDVSLERNISNFNLINVPTAFTGQAALSFTTILKQASTNIYNVNFAINVDGVNKSLFWPSGFVPIVSASYGAVDVLSFLTFNAGETWFGFVAGQGY